MDNDEVRTDGIRLMPVRSNPGHGEDKIALILILVRKCLPVILKRL